MEKISGFLVDKGLIKGLNINRILIDRVFASGNKTSRSNCLLENREEF
jgi:hypothetical protein